MLHVSVTIFSYYDNKKSKLKTESLWATMWTDFWTFFFKILVLYSRSSCYKSCLVFETTRYVNQSEDKLLKVVDTCLANIVCHSGIRRQSQAPTSTSDKSIASTILKGASLLSHLYVK